MRPGGRCRGPVVPGSRRGRRASRASRRTPTAAERRRAGGCGRSGPAKMAGHHLAQFLDLRSQGSDQRDLPGHDGRAGGLDRRRLAELRHAQHGLDLPCSGRGVTAVRPPHRGGNLRLRQRRGPIGIGNPGEQLEGAGRVQVSEGPQRHGKNPRSAARSRSTCRDQPAGSAEKTASDLMARCAPASPGHVIPSAVTSPHDQRAHGLPQGLKSQMSGVLTRQPLPEPSLPNPGRQKPLDESA